MKRREFISLVGAAAAWPLAAEAQEVERARRVGVLIGYDENDLEAKAWFSGFMRGLAELGWTAGRNLRMDVRWSGGDIGRVRMFAKELVDLRPPLRRRRPVRSSGKRIQFRSFLRLSEILWAMVLWRACRAPAEISLAS